MIPAGYFARRVAPRPDHLRAAGVRQVCSVSECISPGADDWIPRWRHNGFGWFNSVSDALSVVPAEHRAQFRLFAYRLHPEVFRGDGRAPLTPPADVRPEPLPEGFRTIGFDSASTLDLAIVGAARFAAEQPEPGDYYVVEVLEGSVRSAPSLSTNAERAST